MEIHECVLTPALVQMGFQSIIDFSVPVCMNSVTSTHWCKSVKTYSTPRAIIYSLFNWSFRHNTNCSFKALISKLSQMP